MRYLVTSLILAGCLSACGYKGPLYLPSNNQPAPAAASQPAATVQPHQDASQP
ncbi:lipoprotein [Paludibacterium sp.]|uniref:LPS translocon maturation chaperone LptM n=1 Tax=Paludibacterium sp. TaxID=1917523 RepID=UPI00344D9C8A